MKSHHPDNWVCIGRHAKPLALQGALTFNANLDLPKDLPQVLDLFFGLKFDRKKVKWIKPHPRGLSVQFEDIVDRNASEALIGADLYAPENIFSSRPGETIYLKEIFGFEVIDAEKGAVGVVESVSSNGAQDLLILRRNEQEILIPFVDAFIEQINFEERRILMRLPEGLF